MSASKTDTSAATTSDIPVSATSPPASAAPHAPSVFKIIPFFHSSDIEATVNVYTKHLGFSLGGIYHHDPTSPVPTFASLFIGPKAAANIYFSTNKDITPARAMIAIRTVEALNELYERLKQPELREVGLEVVEEIQDQPWGYRQFDVSDRDGNRIVWFAFLEDGEQEEEQ